MFTCARNTLPPDSWFVCVIRQLSRLPMAEPRRMEWKSVGLMTLRQTGGRSFPVKDKLLPFKITVMSPTISVYFYMALIGCKHTGTELG